MSRGFFDQINHDVSGNQTYFHAHSLPGTDEIPGKP